MESIQMINDLPAEKDLLSFERYLDPLIEIISNPQSQTPFTVGIFGSWGSGKSTLMESIEDKLSVKHHDLEFFCINFNPWNYREEENLIVPLLHTIQDILNKDSRNKIAAAAKKIGAVLTRLGAALLLKTMTANLVTIEDIEKQEKAYMEQHHRSKSAIRNLRKNLGKIINEITDDGKQGRVVFFIDDLDRCEPDQIIALLESIKLFLDVKHCFFLLALDEEVIQRGIQIKYHKFDFEERKKRIGREYLEKMIQLPLYLYPLSENEVEEYIKSVSSTTHVKDQASLFSDIVLPNPRKIKRILNLYILNLAIAEKAKKLQKQIKNDILARLIVIQVQDYELYLEISNNKDLPEYLSAVYQGKIKTHKDEDWAKLNERRGIVRGLCKSYYHPGSWIERVFKPQDAFPPVDQLEPYFNMLGRGKGV